VPARPAQSRFHLKILGGAAHTRIPHTDLVASAGGLRASALWRAVERIRTVSAETRHHTYNIEEWLHIGATNPKPKGWTRNNSVMRNITRKRIVEPSVDGQPTAQSAPVVDLERIAKAVREILIAVGEDPEREGLRDTPSRVARMYAEMLRGLRHNPRHHLRRVFSQRYDEIVLIKNISFESLCEHHLLPFFGHIHVAYLPNGKVVGLSKIPRLIEDVVHRPQVQESITVEIADLLMSELDARGVAVVVEAEHTCMTIRGVRKPGSLCTTSAMRGIFKDNPSTRSELMALLNAPKSF
jgi:GTP cyclohydrolase I